MSCSIPMSSARIAEADETSPPNRPREGRVEEQHRVAAERPIRPAGVQEVDRRRGQAAELDLAGDLLDEIVALLVGPLAREAHAGISRRSGPRTGTVGPATTSMATGAASARSNAV